MNNLNGSDRDLVGLEGIGPRDQLIAVLAPQGTALDLPSEPLLPVRGPGQPAHYRIVVRSQYEPIEMLQVVPGGHEQPSQHWGPTVLEPGQLHWQLPRYATPPLYPHGQTPSAPPIDSPAFLYTTDVGASSGALANWAGGPPSQASPSVGLASPHYFPSSGHLTGSPLEQQPQQRRPYPLPPFFPQG